MSEDQFRPVFCLIWSDDKFPFLSDDAQLVWFHIYTCEQSNALGVFKASIEALAADKRWPVERYRKAFMECSGERYMERSGKCSDEGLIEYDKKALVIRFPRFFKWNRPKNPNTLKSWLKGLKRIPSSPLKNEQIRTLKYYAERWGDGFVQVVETLGGTLGDLSSPQEQEQEQEQDINTPPTGGGVSDYPEEFEATWRVYPKRDGANPKKSAHKAWRARVKGGAAPKEIQEGVLRYAAYCRERGQVGTRFVLQAVTFFGPEDPPYFKQAWKSSAGQPGIGQGAHVGFDHQDFGVTGEVP